MIFPEPLPLCHGYGCVGLGDKRSIPVVHLLVTLYCVAIHASRLADDQSGANMHTLLLLMFIAILISPICSDEPCIAWDSNMRLSRGNSLVWDSMPSLQAAYLILQVFVPYLRVQGAHV